MNNKIAFVSLGCPKNLVDSEQLISVLVAEGYQIINNYADAAIVVINTCGFIEEAITESLETIAEALTANGKVIVTGCLGSKPQIILDKFPQVLHISGPNQQNSLLTAIHEQIPPPAKQLLQIDTIKLTPPHYAYLKIAEGCNNNCSYCIIPQLRGRLVSRPLKDILNDAENLVAKGTKELLIIAQDTAAYGNDLADKNADIITLANELGKLGVWIRLHYLYPYPHIDKLLPLMAERRIVPYLDVPLQHVNQQLLQQMRRPAATTKIRQRLKLWRDICPDVAIRSTFIVGFPGETDDQFYELLDFLDETQLDRVGCFQYSPVTGAAANQLPNQIPADIKQERFEQFMHCQTNISAQKQQAMLGKKSTVLVDTVDGDQIIARSYRDAPEIDGVVYLPYQENINPGDFIDVTITEANDYDLVGILAD